jgi:hypothetical protein
MTNRNTRNGLRRLLAAALSLALILSLVAQPALAAGLPALPQQGDKSHPDATSYRVTCANGECSIALDLGGEMQSSSVVPKDLPIKLELPEGAVPFLSQGAGIEIGENIKLTMPFGTIDMQDGDFSLHLDENGNLDRLHGRSASITPRLNLGPNLQLAGPFGAEVGYDYGSTLSGLSTVLDPEKRYLFFHLGSGLELDANVPGAAADGEPMRFTIPEGDTFSIVIDPSSALVYLDGRLTLAQITDVGMLLGLMGLQPAAIPLLSGIVLPTRTTIGVGGLLSPDMSKNFLQFTGGMGINGGPLARLLRIEGEPLGFDGLLRVDSDGLLLGGVAKSSVNPDQAFETRGELSVFIPFSLEELPYVQVGGKLRVPVVGIETEIAQQIGGGPVSELTSSNALLESTAEAANAWWSKTGPWMAGVAGVVAGGSASLLDALQEAAENTSESMSGGASTVWNTVRDSTGKIIEGTGSVVGAGVNAAGGAVQAAGSALGSGAAAAGDALKGAGSAVGSGAAAAASGAANVASGAAAGASGAWSSTASAVDCAAQQARNLWCSTTGRCEVEEVVCE